MARSLVIGNGNILINFDEFLNMRDFYYPYVGQLNHISGHKNSIGVWVGGQFSWLEDGSWQIIPGYRRNALVTQSRMVNSGLGIELVNNDCVHYKENIFLRRLKVKNTGDQQVEARVFFTHDFSIDETDVGDTAFFDSHTRALFHYKKNRYFLINGFCGPDRFYEYATGTKRFSGAEGTWRDAEDGRLGGNPIAQGSVDSAVSFRMYLRAGEERTIYYWICVNRNYRLVGEMDANVREDGPELLLRQVEGYWRTWVTRARGRMGILPESLVEQYRLSLLMVQAHFDNRGAVIAACDSDIMHTNRDHYCYMWPRDGALVTLAMIKAGYRTQSESFFQFCAEALTKGGYLLHKYNPDGTMGSSWHPWVVNGESQLPIQEDETALVLYTLWELYLQTGDMRLVLDNYRRLVRPMADFIAGYIDNSINLPRPSYDLWEERRGVYTFTAATVYAGLKAAAGFAALFGDNNRSRTYSNRATQIKEGIETNLYNESLGRYIRGLVYDRKTGHYEQDTTLESSVSGLFLFDVLPTDDPRLTSTMEAVEKGLWINTEVGGIARYTADCYFKRSQDIRICPGNPWVLCTLWLAQWHARRASRAEELDRALELLNWANSKALPGGMLPEQLDPYTGTPLSVTPLTWSHATYIMAVLDYLEKKSSFTPIV